MPSTSKKQHNFMAAVANNPSFAKKAGVPQSVGKEFNKADKGKFSKGGNIMATKGVNPFAKFEKSGKDVEKKGMKEGSKADMAMDRKQMAMKKGGMTRMAMGGYADGGMSMVNKGGKMVPSFAADGVGKMKKGGMAKMMSSGGSASKRADGIATKGKTKGKMMSKGGKAC